MIFIMDIKKILTDIVENANNSPACKDCTSYKNGGCSFGCLNEKVKITSPNYSCNNFKSKYEYDESTVAVLTDLFNDVKRVDEGLKNFELLIDGKITEKDFVDIEK